MICLCVILVHQYIKLNHIAYDVICLCVRFAINLSCGPSPDDDIAFHFNPRFNVGVVVRNTRQGGAWGTEEQHQSSFPFDHDDQFDLLCVFLQHGVRVRGKVGLTCLIITAKQNKHFHLSS